MSKIDLLNVNFGVEPPHPLLEKVYIMIFWGGRFPYMVCLCVCNACATSTLIMKWWEIESFNLQTKWFYFLLYKYRIILGLQNTYVICIYKCIVCLLLKFSEGSVGQWWCSYYTVNLHSSLTKMCFALKLSFPHHHAKMGSLCPLWKDWGQYKLHNHWSFVLIPKLILTLKLLRDRSKFEIKFCLSLLSKLQNFWQMF